MKKLDLDDLNLLLEALEFMKMKNEKTDYPTDEFKYQRVSRLEALRQKLEDLKSNLSTNDS